MDPQQNTPSTPPVPPPTPAPMSAPPAATPVNHSSPVGSIIGAIIVIAIIVLGGLYFWGAQLEQEQIAEQELPFLLPDEGLENEGIPPTSSSDEVFDIEADVDATDLEAFEAALDADLQNLDTATAE